MNHTAAENLNPALALAQTAAFAVAVKALYIQLCGWLGEWEVMWSETNNRVLAIQTFYKYLQGTFEVCHGDVFVHNQTLDLMEQWRVGCIQCIRTVNTAWCNDADRWFLFFHNTDLHWGGLGSQNDIVVDIEGILGISCRVILWDVERLEVVVVKLNLRSLCNIKAHAHEDFFELIQYNADWMFFAQHTAFAWHGDIQCFGCKALVEHLSFQLGLGLFEFFFNLCADLVCQLSDDRTLLCGKFSHLFEDGGQLSLFTKIFYSDSIQCFQVLCAFQLGKCLFFNRFQLRFHCKSFLSSLSLFTA